MTHAFAPPAPRPCPQPLTDEVVADYRTAMTRTDGSIADLGARFEAADRLARRAFEDKDRAAWEVVQVMEWNLQDRSAFWPTEPGDVLVLDTLYKYEDAHGPTYELPKGLSTADFVAKLERDVRENFVINSPEIPALAQGTHTDAEWQYIGYQWSLRAVEFARFIALSSIRQPHAIAYSIYRNLYDEAGETDSRRAHLRLLENFLCPFGIQTSSKDEMLYWTSPESVAVENFQLRMFWKRHPGWALGSAYVVEKLLPPQVDFIRDGLRLRGVPEERLTWFQVHIEGDVLHAADWLELIASAIQAPEDQLVVYSAAIERAQRLSLCWDCYDRDFMAWKKMGIPPHLPFRELHTRVGI
jgi:hypothetical protein